MRSLSLALLSSIYVLVGGSSTPKLDRQAIVSRYNPTRNVSSANYTTPMQVGNGNFAFGADITGMQTFQPWAIMTTWGMKNDSFPPGKTQDDVENYRGISWLNHGRPVQYDFGGNDPAIEQWLTANPNRVNLANIALVYYDTNLNEMVLKPETLGDAKQMLNLWSGTLTSHFTINGSAVTVVTQSSMESDTVALSISSSLVSQNRLALRLDFPWNDGSQKFEAPYVGTFNLTQNHTTALQVGIPSSNIDARISHIMDNTTFYSSLKWGRHPLKISRDSRDAHRYTVRLDQTVTMPGEMLSLTVTFTDSIVSRVPAVSEVLSSSAQGWKNYWSSGGFVDLTDTEDARAEELQRRIVLSQYLLRVNEAGDTPPQESGLVNNGWYGKFHMEMFWWHSIHWATWNQWSVLNRASSIYERFLPSSIRRAQVQQGWPGGARWPKMTDPLGRSSPGEINNLLIWEQPHPIVFAEYEYRAFPTKSTLQKWMNVVNETANWMSVFAWFNSTATAGSDHYDIGPPMFVVSEDTSPNVTQNPSFELAYYRYTLNIAQEWMKRSGETPPSLWSEVADNLAPLPQQNGTYQVYEGIEDNFWDDPAYTNDHPALVGLYGWLPQTPGLDLSIAQATTEKVWSHWNISNCWGWDFPMLAMSAARLGQQEAAIDWLLHPLFQFDDVGMPVGGVRVPTPYFPGSGSLLYAVGMMAAGWDNHPETDNAPGFPVNWTVKMEGISKAI